MNFKCPSCQMQLVAEPEMAGKIVRCPGCNSKLQIPAAPPVPEPLPAEETFHSHQEPRESAPPPRIRRTAWKESDPTNVNIWIALCISAVLTVMTATLAYTIKNNFVGQVYWITTDTTSLSGLLVTGGQWVNHLEMLLFWWGIGIVLLKITKSKHQRQALLLNCLPSTIGDEINPNNVSHFLDHVYSLPSRLRDSIMVNRIRKGLEVFEARPNNSETASLLSAQSDIDANRVTSSYSLLKVFLWAIPILGFIGTVLGLSLAIGLIGNVDLTNPDQLNGAIKSISSGLGTAFNTTLLGLLLSMALIFPMNSMQSQEEDTVLAVDAYCNENLISRLNDGGGSGGFSGDAGDVAQHLVKAVAESQKEFLADLNKASTLIRDLSENLEKRAKEHQEKVEEQFTRSLEKITRDTSDSVTKSVENVTKYFTAMEGGIRSLNDVLKNLGEKQVVIQQIRKKGWFGRG